MLTLYQRDNSMLTFESASVAGSVGIVEKLSVSNPTPCDTAFHLTNQASHRPCRSRKSNMPCQRLMRNLLEIMVES